MGTLPVPKLETIEPAAGSPLSGRGSVVASHDSVLVGRPMMFEFGSFELDLAARELRRAGRPVPLQPRVFGVLRYLIEHRDRVVSKQELIEALWGGSQLNAVAVPWAINRARRF